MLGSWFIVRYRFGNAGIQGGHNLLTAELAARDIAQALRRDDELWAFKTVLQSRDHVRVLLASKPGKLDGFEADPPPTGSIEWDAFLATVINHEFQVHGLPAPKWSQVPALAADWVLDNPRWDEAEIRDRTPGWLAERRIFVAVNDLITL